jgi:hypothetical protein
VWAGSTLQVPLGMSVLLEVEIMLLPLFARESACRDNYRTVRGL